VVVEMLREAGRFRGEGRGLGTLAHSGEDVALLAWPKDVEASTASQERGAHRVRG
jgi:hypothetical protein